jgi:hypothetical protein
MPDRLPRVEWPRTFPICALLGIVAALFFTTVTAFVQVRLMRPLERLYVGPFLRTSIVPFHLTIRLIEVRAPGRGYIMAVDPWISFYREQGRSQIGLTKSAIEAGLANPRLYLAEDISPQTIRPFFERSIFHGTVAKTFRPTIVAFCILFAAGLLLGAWFDQQHNEAARRGIQIRGPRLMPPRKAQKYLKGDGIALFLEPKAR